MNHVRARLYLPFDATTLNDRRGRYAWTRPFHRSGSSFSSRGSSRLSLLPDFLERNSRRLRSPGLQKVRRDFSRRLPLEKGPHNLPEIPSRGQTNCIVKIVRTRGALDTNPVMDNNTRHVAEETTRARTLGNVRLRHPETNEIILIPTPSADPNDPLNW